MTRRRGTLIALTIAVVLASPAAALASVEDVCIDSANEAERLKKDVSKLTRAREQLRACARDECPTVIRDDCRQSLVDIENQLPTVVLLAEDESGVQLFDATVTFDGDPLASQLDGKPIATDAGAHTFTFVRQGIAPVDVRIVLVAGQKNVQVRARFPRTAAAPPAIPIADPLPASPSTDTSTSASSLSTAGLVIAGAGVVGLGLGTIFGLGAASKQSDADCPNNRCRDESSASTLRDAQASATLSTVFFVAGAALAAGGLTLFFVAPKGPSTTSGVRSPTVLGMGARVLGFGGLSF